jgi:glycosyltransferase involved in cell wall biosynthesis
MTGDRRSILIDARVNALPGAHGIARSVMQLAAHMTPPPGGRALRVLVNAHREQIFPLSALPPHAGVIDTDITLPAVHRCRELARLIRAAGADVLWVPYPTFTPVIRPCPVVVTIHDCTIENDVGFAGGRHRQAGLRLATWAVLRRAAATTAPTRAALTDILQHYPYAPRPTLVPNGVDTRPFAGVTPADVAAARTRYQLPRQFILTVGAHRPHKNHGTLVRALARLPAAVSLVIVGYFDRNFPDPLPGLIARLGLESRVRLIPEVDDGLLPAVYRAASVFAFPSLAEGYGLPVLEAMACGTPVVASDIPALAEVSGSAAVLVPPDDLAGWTGALGRVLADPAAAARLAVAGPPVAAGAGWDRGAAALSGVLSDVADGRRAAFPAAELPPAGSVVLRAPAPAGSVAPGPPPAAGPATVAARGPAQRT